MTTRIYSLSRHSNIIRVQKLLIFTSHIFWIYFLNNGSRTCKTYVNGYQLSSFVFIPHFFCFPLIIDNRRNVLTFNLCQQLFNKTMNECTTKYPDRFLTTCYCPNATNTHNLGHVHVTSGVYLLSEGRYSSFLIILWNTSN